GRLLATLKAEGVDGNTVVFFTSDNGGLSTLDRRRPGPTSVLPLRAGKGWCYEGGIRVPWIVYDPKNPGKNRTSGTPIISADLYPTVLDYAGLEPMPEQHRDGVSVRPVMADTAAQLKRTEPLVWHYPHYHGSGWLPGSAIREGDWKLIEHYHDEKTELFNLAGDLSESRDVSADHPEKTKDLRNKLRATLKKIGAAMPRPNPNPKPRDSKKKKKKNR
ncbi:MAG: sulfatase-like hydrolase/transferase, partial [Phycisphaeraceae bacterium]|nr:sulfatase-like hydrolase/transferase [Phycisphaeraceae bacterium]